MNRKLVYEKTHSRLTNIITNYKMYVVKKLGILF